MDETLKLPYVDTLAETDRVVFKTEELTLKAFAEQLKERHLQAVQHRTPPIVFKPIIISYKGAQEHYYSYCHAHNIHGFGKQRLIINHRQADLSDNPISLSRNRLIWQAPGITRIRRHRWPVEGYREEGKAEGLDQYQLRSFSIMPP